MTVIVVDDDRKLAEAVCELIASIEDYAINCVIAGTKRETLEACARHAQNLHLVILDLQLPDGPGMKLASEIRELCPYAPVVIITGDASLKSAVAAVGGGAFAYLLKPFPSEELVETVRRAVAQALLLREREALRCELEVSERRHRELVEGLPGFVLALDEHGKIVLWNRCLEEVTGFGREEMLGTAGSDLVGQGGDRRLPLKGGGHRLVRWRRAQFESPGNSPITYALGSDVTDEREMLRRTLRAERLAAVGTLATGLAHEVRNPLNAANLQLQLLKRRVDGEASDSSELLRIIDVVRAEIGRVDSLVSDFLSFAQSRPLKLVATDLNALLLANAERIRPEAARARVEVCCELDSEIGLVEAEPERLERMLSNLIQNALDAMQEGGRLFLRSRAADAHGNVMIEVEDTGSGFAEDAPIFDAFYTTKPGGTGLGLAVVHRIVADHGGTILAESQPGRTRLSVCLPQVPGSKGRLPPRKNLHGDPPDTQI